MDAACPLLLSCMQAGKKYTIIAFALPSGANVGQIGVLSLTVTAPGSSPQGPSPPPPRSGLALGVAP